MSEIKDGIEDAGKKLKASVEAAASKVKGPDKDLDAIVLDGAMTEIKDGIEDAGKKLKASVEAAASKVKGTDKDLEAEYVKEKSKEKSLEESQSSTDSSTAKLSKLTPSSIPQYKKILVPDDSSELSDKALSHAIYLSNVTGAEIVILNIVKDIGKIQPTTISATTTTTTKEERETGEGEEEVEVAAKRTTAAVADDKKDIQITIEGHAEQIMEKRIRLCKEAGAKNQISYKMQTGKNLVEEILNLSDNMNIDLIVMASSKVTSPILGLASITRKVIDGSKNPVLVINEE
jgi:nucleotide-binding universal stress UspA family protein